MEKFEGIGAACIARFHEAGMAGRIMWGEREVARGRGKGYSSWISDVGPWLLEKCTYTPPEPVWREVTPGQALDAWLAGKTVQRKHPPEEHRVDGEEWATLIPDGQHGRPHLWQAHHEYRVQEDA